MTLHSNKNRTVGELQVAFSDIYAYLKLELFENSRGTWKKLSSGTPLKPLKNSNIPEFEFSDSTIVSEFESSFLRAFGIYVQVSRKSWNIWMEPTITDKWTLKQQNDIGRELSTPNIISMNNYDTRVW